MQKIEIQSNPVYREKIMSVVLKEEQPIIDGIKEIRQQALALDKGKPGPSTQAFWSSLFHVDPELAFMLLKDVEKVKDSHLNQELE